jgi:hypothetical protein
MTVHREPMEGQKYNLMWRHKDWNIGFVELEGLDY